MRESDFREGSKKSLNESYNGQQNDITINRINKRYDDKREQQNDMTVESLLEGRKANTG